jgi:hypothetical protein
MIAVCTEVINWVLALNLRLVSLLFEFDEEDWDDAEDDDEDDCCIVCVIVDFVCSAAFPLDFFFESQVSLF